MTRKSIIINKKAHKELCKLSEVFNSSYGNLVEHMIYYFKRTGINPKDAVNENPSVMVKALDKRIVSFLKVQERDILKPIRNDIFIFDRKQQSRLNEITDLNKTTLEEINNRNNNRMNLVKNELNKQQRAIRELSVFLDEKNKTGIQQKIKNIFN